MMLENDPSLSQVKLLGPEDSPRYLLNVPDFEFLGDTADDGKEAEAAQDVVGGTGADADGTALWTWNNNNPIRAEIESIRRFCALAQQLSDRERHKRDKEKARTQTRMRGRATEQAVSRPKTAQLGGSGSGT